MNKSMGALGGVVLALLALLVAGCGGSGQEALTKSEFVKQGNAICTKATKEREKALAELFSTKTDPNASQKALQKNAVETAIPIYEGAAEQLAELGVPAGDEAKVEGVVDAMEEAAASIRANPKSAFGEETPFRKANKAAESYGLDDCVA